MMKYAVNHYKNFANPYASFFVGFVQLMMAYATEILTIIVLTSKLTIIDIVMAYMAFYPITFAKIYFFETLWNHKIQRCAGLQLKFKIFRSDKPL